MCWGVLKRVDRSAVGKSDGILDGDDMGHLVRSGAVDRLDIKVILMMDNKI